MKRIIGLIETLLNGLFPDTPHSAMDDTVALLSGMNRKKAA